jgi:hypothetical protein
VTEQQWLDCTEPEDLIRYLRDARRLTRTKAGRRKLRLFACACCRAVWDLILDARCRRAVEATEALADEQISKAEHERAREAAKAAAGQRWQTGWEVCRLDPTHETTILWRAARAAELAADREAGLSTVAGPIIAKDVSRRGSREEKRYQVALIRDLVGNPFQGVVPEGDWLAWDGGRIPKMAQQMYEERAFGQLPVLADALEDAGCAVPEILSHLRGPGPHVRGCWALDLLRLGKQ